ncbi:MAG: SWIM zinc finger family protein [Gemmataceae bacterium]|nr:SWIM zinc finger family protein [Planctomycetia bacterium]MBX3399377.1 SWIM zinc finger family protein [Gemmataceae bacterium]
MSWYSFKPYVPVATRRAKAAREVARRAKSGKPAAPVVVEGRAIAESFWGKAWCANLESYSDFENRLPRGRTYVRNGSVVDLAIGKGKIESLVSGSELYEIQITIDELPKARWTAFKADCAGRVGTLVELLRGRLSNAVMERVTDRARGLFPAPKEIRMRCSCPDYAGMCKHVAATMYGVGHRLDREPELLFRLRGVDHAELIETAVPATLVAAAAAPTIAAGDLADVFGIAIDETPRVDPPAPSRRPRSKHAPAKAKKAKQPAAKKPPKKG